MIKKYELVHEDFIMVNRTKLFRIRALRSFLGVKAGELGGYVQNESNLSHQGRCWIYDHARVYHGAKVVDGGTVRDRATVTDGSIVRDYSVVKDDTVVTDHSNTRGEAVVGGNSHVEHSDIGGNSEVGDYAHIHSESVIKGQCKIGGNAEVNNAVVEGASTIGADSYVGKECHLKNATLIGSVEVTGESYLSGIRIGFKVSGDESIAIYSDPTNHCAKIAVSKYRNEATSWNANGTIEDVIAAQHNEEGKAKMRSLLQAHKDIYNIK